ncbi:hypothetical protein K3162_03415 [Qipengyuania xiapuensis]|uniref:Exonuclease domain-containing protein n=1 Tax=Qipengyuania xiapuensis TaxID=2867236 RepID=A0ABX8ZW24_9SPHN|nr:exonuclease domain-containing protein [Qipengyuania xiapuensis]QZD93099.1 hypothetical protein K3162_03415 [Qipengyuania xiapuensis]
MRRWRFARRLKECARSDHTLLRAYAEAEWPAASAPISRVPLLALDFELDGLGKDAHVLQAGWLPFNLSGIDLSQACSRDIRSKARLDDDAVAVHGIGETRAREGEHRHKVTDELLAALAGKVVVAHGASIERGVVERLVAQRFGIAPPVRAICTLELERKLSPGLVGTEVYRLEASRSRYNLSPHSQHDALADALASAELFLAQLTRMGREMSLGSLEC